MRVFIHYTMSFKMNFTRNREEILKAKIDYLKECNDSDERIESLLYAQRYSMKEINEILTSYTPTYKYCTEINRMIPIKTIENEEETDLKREMGI